MWWCIKCAGVGGKLQPFKSWKESAFTRTGPLATVLAMKNLLTFLAAIYYVPLAILIAVTIIEHWRAASRQTPQTAHDDRLQEAA